jgi:hypothetical protein
LNTMGGNNQRREDLSEKYNQILDDNQWRHSLEGHGAEEFDEAEALDYHEDDYIKTPGHIYNDFELESVVKELLKNSRQVQSDDITVTADNTNIVLSGTVKSESEKNAAGSLVQLIHGVGMIKNNLIVKLNEGILPSDVGRNP